MGHVFEIYVRCEPHRLWGVITDPRARGHFQFGSTVRSTWTNGSGYQITHPAFAHPLILGENLEVDPPRLLVQTFRPGWDRAVAGVGPSQVTWRIERTGDSCRLVVAHNWIPADITAAVLAGWPMVLSGLKTWMETGQDLDTPGAFGLHRRSPSAGHRFAAIIDKGLNKGGSIHVAMPGSAAVFGTRRSVRVRGRIDGVPVIGSFVPTGDGSHRLTVPDDVRRRIGKRVGGHGHRRDRRMVGYCRRPELAAREPLQLSRPSGHAAQGFRHPRLAAQVGPATVPTRPRGACQARTVTTTLITGATRGVGLELARRLAAAGHDVWVGARDVDRGRQVAASIGARAVALDVTDAASVRAAADRLAGEVDVLDVLVNNAGISDAQRRPAEAEPEDLVSVFATNVVGATRVLVACTALLERSANPVVVNVSSAVGSLTLNARPDAVWSLVAYPMSKAALNMLTIQYARAYPRWRVNSVTPGLTLTEFTGRSIDSIDLPGFRRVGGKPVDEAVEILVTMATLGADGPTGTFVGNDGPLPW